MKITNDLVRYVANLSRIKLDDKQEEKISGELAAIIDYMEVLGKLDTENVEPLSHVFSITNVMRDDEVKNSYEREQLLMNAPDHTDETFVVPKTVD